ncbi:class I SAM-dependent methyltransferase [Streptomyces sp. SID13031]|uniref:class I SAM-dependent methyltransferase n=1 Tax=Streptomyces sp. SID13031 TaxID=2706046 RepID=UPI0013CBD25D|nr:class I SAM-dependent methyltransferase [Streptomyces sp. SID13031]NEA35091.1 class I SAM-dependent methyltransferase [Streptomyces sp. SID13031]
MTETLTPAFDQARADTFGQQMGGVLNNATLALLVSIGHQVGLYETLSQLPPATSHEIAGAANLQERYVREWLGAMTTARVVEYYAADRTYWLPPEHAASLTRAAGPGNLAGATQFIALLAGVEAHVVDCFRNGGGVPYAEYTEFHRLMAEDSGAVFDAALIDNILPLVPGLPKRLQSGIEVADVGCGSGHAVNLIAQAYPLSRCNGYDFSDEGIAAGREEAARLGLRNAEFAVRDVSDLGERDQFDLVTAFDSIHDQAHPAQVLAGIAASLRPGGVFLMVDIQASSNLEDNLENPMATFLYGISTMHCMTVSLSLDGDGLGTVWGRQKAEQMLTDAGFTSVEVTHVDADAFNAYYIATKQ